MKGVIERGEYLDGEGVCGKGAFTRRMCMCVDITCVCVCVCAYVRARVCVCARACVQLPNFVVLCT